VEEVELDAYPYAEAVSEYGMEFKNLLNDIYICYTKMIENNIQVPKNENKIRDILVDSYLEVWLSEYTFKKEALNNLGRVDIYIIDNFIETKPHFIVECKLLDNKNVDGKDGLNGKYIQNGILRFLTEHYYLNNGYSTNAMIGFVVQDLSIGSNIQAINSLSEKIFKNIVEIINPISLIKNHIYTSFYQTGKPEKDFHIYHLMMDFSNNLQQSEQPCQKPSN
jgi:hypothetical protein